MADRWILYQRRPGLVLGFHGTSRKTVNKLVGQRKRAHLIPSQGKNEWLGHGIYFWENDPQRALEWAENGNPKQPIADPDVVGAVLDLGLCLDLTTRTGLDEVAQAYRTLRDLYAQAGFELERNTGGRDRLNRELDCQVIQALHDYRKQHGQPPYDSVRSPFPEADELYQGAGFRAQNHIQIAIINPACIKGYFRPLQPE
ncbi:MAG: hypothetical protein RBT55_04350 [Rhodocyclaceae bacterium]|nr:hypothetical protein [Rhodocyclaceae bacterium]